MQLALLATLLAGSHALAPVIQPRQRTVLHSDMIKGSIVGEDGITAEVAPQDDDLANPPQTMAQCLQQAQDATVAAIEDGQILMDVEFPPLAADLMDDPNTSAGMISASRGAAAPSRHRRDSCPSDEAVGGFFFDFEAVRTDLTEMLRAGDMAGANTRLAIKYAQGIHTRTGKKVAILYPDVPELERAVEQSGSNTPQPGVSLHSLRASISEAETPQQAFFALFGKGKEMVREVPEADVYVGLTFSAQELPDVEELDTREQSKKPIILFNLKLDTQRGDLGLPAFPPKDLQWRFLSRAKAVYFLRTRQYTLSLPEPPFVVNYQGAIFRQYPGPFQCLLDTGKAFRPVSTSQRRPALGEFKETITMALKIGAKSPSNEGKNRKFFRTGVKAITWWEEDKEGLEVNKPSPPESRPGIPACVQSPRETCATGCDGDAAARHIDFCDPSRRRRGALELKHTALRRKFAPRYRSKTHRLLGSKFSP